MYKIKYIDHIADIGFTIKATSIEELFSASLLEMFNILCEKDKLEGKIIRGKNKITGESKEILLFNLLKEYLDNFYMNYIVISKINEIKINDNNILINHQGIKFNPDKIILKNEIKAITYHKLKIKKTNNLYTTTLIFDV